MREKGGYMHRVHPDQDTGGDMQGGDSKVGLGRKVEPMEKAPEILVLTPWLEDEGC